MSILIKDISMPKCGELNITIDTLGGVAYTDKDMKAHDIIEVPTPHGDLIDRQQIYNKIAWKTVGALEELVKLSPFKDTAEFLWKNAILKEREDLKSDVVYAPIIIESEE